jgi:hypothetical protein
MTKMAVCQARLGCIPNAQGEVYQYAYNRENAEVSKRNKMASSQSPLLKGQLRVGLSCVHATVH